MSTNGQRDDVLLAVPFLPLSAHGLDPTIRQTLGAHMGTSLDLAVADFEQCLGRSLNVLRWTGHPMFDGALTTFTTRRSLTAMALATDLEAHGLRWAAIDPGARELRYWRRCFERLRRRPPRVVALSTTFVMGAAWLRALCGLIRRILPQSTLVLGGCYYLTNVREFLSMDADVFCIGEGEQRLAQIVAAIRDGASPEGIPGLYLRGSDGMLRSTGRAAPLDLDRLAPVDWRLSARMEPAVDFAREPGYFAVETQRGCAFRCEFCTFRMLAAHVTMSPERAAAAILDTGAFPHGAVFLTDATATRPQQRWQEVLQRLIARGGSRHPITAFARVSDLNEEVAELMARAGVRGVIIGQESGHQPLLNAMRKGTKVEQVPAAMAALGKFGVAAHFMFIHGFPGETEESIRATRAMITGLNQPFQAEPVALNYGIGPFSAFDFAVATRRVTMEREHHFMGYEVPGFSPARIGEEMLITLMASSRVPHAPLCSFAFNGLADALFNVADRPHRYELFRWLKAIERGVGIFLQQRLEGTKPDAAELAQLRQAVLAHCLPRSRCAAWIDRMLLRRRVGMVRRLQAEWLAEPRRGPGRFTRLFAAGSAWRDFGRWGEVWRAWQTATYPDTRPPRAEAAAEIERLAAALLQEVV